MNILKDLLRHARALADELEAGRQWDDKAATEVHRHALRFTAPAMKAQRFVLPDGGILIEDDEKRALQEVPVVRLPFPCVSLEFSFEDSDGRRRQMLIVAQEFEASNRIGLAFWERCGWERPGARWGCIPPVLVPMAGLVSKDENGVAFWVQKCTDIENEYTAPLQGFGLNVFGSFLNALACTNVSAECNAPSRTYRAMAAASGDRITQQDSFHTLVLNGKKTRKAGGKGGSHSSPREHVRRGHIRLLEKGPVWVNSTIVNAGAAARVRKVYELRRSMAA